VQDATISRESDRAQAQRGLNAELRAGRKDSRITGPSAVPFAGERAARRERSAHDHEADVWRASPVASDVHDSACALSRVAASVFPRVAAEVSGCPLPVKWRVNRGVIVLSR
jgi:hypothetical protein